MDIQKACESIKKEHPTKKIIECLEFGEFFAFAVVDKDFDLEKDFAVGGYETVNKKTGEIGAFNPTSNLRLFMSAKQIKIE